MSIEDSIAEAVVKKLVERGLVMTGTNQTRQKMLDIKQAAEYMSRSASSVRHMVLGGQIPARVVKRFGKRVFLMREELDKWLEAQ